MTREVVMTASEREALIADLRGTGIELAERAAAELSRLAAENARITSLRNLADAAIVELKADILEYSVANQERAKAEASAATAEIAVSEDEVEATCAGAFAGDWESLDIRGDWRNRQRALVRRVLEAALRKRAEKP